MGEEVACGKSTPATTIRLEPTLTTMKIKARGPNFVEIDYTPMIDMTFQLIAFFMILINFEAADRTSSVQLPASVLAKPPETAVRDADHDPDGRDGRIMMGGESMPTPKRSGRCSKTNVHPRVAGPDRGRP